MSRRGAVGATTGKASHVMPVGTKGLNADYYAQREAEAKAKREAAKVKKPDARINEARRQELADMLRRGVKTKVLYAAGFSITMINIVRGELDLGRLGGWGRP